MIGRWVYAVLICVAVLGAILLLIGGILVPVFRNNKIHASTEIGNTSFYFFDISNPDEIVKTGKNTTVSQIGPYVYRLTLEMNDTSFSNKRSRLSYDLYKKYTFDEAASVGNETNEITTVNLPILNLATRLLRTNATVEDSISYLMRDMNERLFNQIRISDLLWGYRNDDLKNLTDFLWGHFRIDPINDTTFGLLHQSGQRKKTTFEGTFEVATETDETFDRWNVRKWNGKSELDVWNSSRCNKINGTDGYAWPLRRNKSEIAYIFDSDWCRSIDLEVVGSGSITKYEYSKDAFRYGGWRRGFCQPTPDVETPVCLRDGVLNVTKCKDNIPLLLSQPHFLDADVSYLNAIHGLNPDPKFHKTFFKIDEASGEVVEGSRKLQLNAYVMKLASFPDTENFTDSTVIPIAWMEEVYSMTEKEKESLVSQRKVYDEIQYSLIGIGAVLFVFALVALLVAVLLNRTLRPEGERQPLLGQ